MFFFLITKKDSVGDKQVYCRDKNTGLFLELELFLNPHV